MANENQTKSEGKSERSIDKYPFGLYSKGQRLAVFGFLMLLTLAVLVLFCFGLLFFRQLSYYGYLFVAAAFAIMFIASLFPLFGKNVDKHFGRVKNWVLPTVTVFLASLLLFFILSEYGILDLSPVIELITNIKG